MDMGLLACPRRGFFLTGCGRLMGKSNSVSFFPQNGSQRPGVAKMPGRSLLCLRLLCVVAYTVHCQPRLPATVEGVCGLKEIAMPARPNRPPTNTFQVLNVFIEEIMRDLSIEEIRVYLYLCSTTRFGELTPPGGPTLRQIAIGCKLSEEDVALAVDDLKRRGLACFDEEPAYCAIDPTPRGKSNG